MNQLISRRSFMKTAAAVAAAPLLDTTSAPSIESLSKVDFFDGMSIVTKVHRGLGQIPGQAIFKQEVNVASERESVKFLVKFCSVLESISETFSHGEYKGFLTYDPHEPGGHRRRIGLLTRYFDKDNLSEFCNSFTAMIDGARTEELSVYARASRPAAIDRDSDYAPDYSVLKGLVAKRGERPGTEAYLRKVRKDLKSYSKVVENFKDLAAIKASRFKDSPSAAAQIAARWLSNFSEGSIANIFNDSVYRAISSITHSSGWEYSRYSTYEKDRELLRRNGISEEEVNMLGVPEKRRELVTKLSAALKSWEEYLLNNKPSICPPAWLTVTVEEAYLGLRKAVPLHDRKDKPEHSLFMILHAAEDVLLQGINGGYDSRVPEERPLRKQGADLTFEIFIIRSGAHEGFKLLSTGEIVAFVPRSAIPKVEDLRLQRLLENEFKTGVNSCLILPGLSEYNREVTLQGVSADRFIRWARSLAKRN